MAKSPTRQMIGDVVGSVLTALLAFGATPLVLFVLVGNPLGHGLGHTWSHSSRLALTGLAVVAWVAWLACCLQLIQDVMVHVRHGSVTPSVGRALNERVAARIAAGILAISTLGAPMVLSGGAGASTSGVNRVNVPTAVVSPTTLVPVSASVAPIASTYVVRAGDSLWTIAETQLGDGADWTTIAQLNLGHTMSDGLHFVDPSLIVPGWTLVLPGPAPIASDPTSYVTATPVVTAPPSHEERSAPHTDPIHTISKLVSAAPKDDGRNDGPAPVRQLPELAVLGFSAIGCAALARRARRRRAIGQQYDAKVSGPPQTDEWVDAETMLARFADIPALTAFERANSLIGSQVDDIGRSEGLPRVRAICVGPAGVDFWLDRPHHSAPNGCIAVNDAMTWRVPHDELVTAPSICPWLSIVLPVGSDHDGTWLVPVPRGTCLPLLGEAAEDLWRSVRPVQRSWVWADSVTISEDPAELTEFLSTAPVSLDVPPILFFGDPTQLPGGVAERVSVVTTSSLHATDVAILVDPRAATIHPLGRTVRPDLIDVGTARLMDELSLAPVAAPDKCIRGSGGAGGSAT